MSNRASAITLVTIFLLCSTSLSFSQIAPHTAEALVAKILDARGGMTRLKAIKAQRITGNISFGPGAEGPVVVELKRPGKMHMEVTIQGQTIVRVYDGRGSGWIVNPFAEDKGVVPMSGNDLQNIADESDFDGPLVDYQSKGNKIEYLGKDEVDGKPAEKLKLTTKSGDVRTYYLDAATLLLIKWEGIRKNDDKEIPVESFFHDYREVNGIKFAFEIDSDSPGTPQSQKLTIEKIELDPVLDDSRFTKPSVPPVSSSVATSHNSHTTASGVGN
jgi:outer membrane lipoprotein-sorting protein